ncbi:MAG: tautomerase family protein [Telmatospirillum sp.]|nr:tautomerase family protein [Telmatospirillum sp.]
MPLVRIELPAGKSAAWKRAVADGVHAALVETAGVPADDRFQILSEQVRDMRIVDPTYLGIVRTADFVLVQIFLSVGRSDAIKRSLYAAIARNLASDPGLRPQDVMIALAENTRVDWSFGNGIAQYVPGP